MTGYALGLLCIVAALALVCHAAASLATWAHDSITDREPDEPPPDDPPMIPP